LCDALERAVPLLVKLGDYIGNDMDRCEVLLAARDALRRRSIVRDMKMTIAECRQIMNELNEDSNVPRKAIALIYVLIEELDMIQKKEFDDVLSTKG
jgi:hypothetical protein